MKKISRTFFFFLAAVVMMLPGPVQIASVADESRVSIERLAGKRRLETVVKVSKKAYQGGADAIVLSGTMERWMP